MKKILFSLLLLSLSLASVHAQDQNAINQSLKQSANAFSQVAKSAIPAVVSIQIKKSKESLDPNSQEDLLRYFFGIPPQQQRKRFKPQEELEPAGQGSGFVISEDGYILTNNHVVGGAKEIEVKFSDGKVLDAKLIGADEKSDVAVIKVEGNGFPTLKLGNSDQLEIGDWAIAIGNPFGLSTTLTVGVISAKGRANMGITDYEDFIQTDAAINPGNSGGPLLDIDGKVIGINTAIYSRSGGYMGIGFAIPIKMALNIKDHLIKYGKVVRGKVGVYISEISEKIAKKFSLKASQSGILVAEVIRGSSGEKAGLKAGDIVLKINGTQIANSAQFRNQISLTPIGQKVTLSILREGQAMDIAVEIEAMDGDPKKVNAQKEISLETYGLNVQELTAKLARRLGLDPDETGVVISEIEPDSLAEAAGLRPGQLIKKVNQVTVNSVEDFEQVVKESDGSLLLLVSDRRGTRFIPLELP
jgi:serine protease Do